MPLFARASGVAVHGSSFTDIARDVNTSVHVHVEAQQASFQIPGSIGTCSRKRNRDSDKDKDKDTTLRIVKRRRLELQSVLTHGSSYQLHAGRQSGREVVIKVFDGLRAEEHFAATLTSSCRRLLHPNVGQMIGKSPDGEESPYIIYRGAGPINRLHPLIAKALRTDLHRSIHLAMKTVKGLAAGIDYLDRQGFPLQTSLSSSQQILDILVGDNDEPLIVVNPAIATPNASVPSYNGDHGRAVFGSLCREIFKEVNAILYDDSPKRDHNYESSSSQTPTIQNTTLGTEDDNLELSSSSILTSAEPRRELWWIDPKNTCLSLVSIARRFDNFLRSIPSSSLSPLRRLYNSKRRLVHQCPGYLREEILLGSDLAKSAIISHLTPDAMERCSVCGELVSSRAGSEEATEICDPNEASERFEAYLNLVPSTSTIVSSFPFFDLFSPEVSSLLDGLDYNQTSHTSSHQHHFSEHSSINDQGFSRHGLSAAAVAASTAMAERYAQLDATGSGVDDSLLDYSQLLGISRNGSMANHSPDIHMDPTQILPGGQDDSIRNRNTSTGGGRDPNFARLSSDGWGNGLGSNSNASLEQDISNASTPPSPEHPSNNTLGWRSTMTGRKYIPLKRGAHAIQKEESFPALSNPQAELGSSAGPPKLSGMDKDGSEEGDQTLMFCTNCQSTETPLWRRDPEGRPLCNTCGLFYKLHGVVRPLSLKTDVIKKRSMAKHNPYTHVDPTQVLPRRQAGSSRNRNAATPPSTERPPNNAPGSRSTMTWRKYNPLKQGAHGIQKEKSFPALSNPQAELRSSASPELSGMDKGRGGEGDQTPMLCTNCQSTSTPLWKRDPEGRPLCNACGLFYKLHGVARPLSLKTDVIKKRNRASRTPSGTARKGTNSLPT